MGIPSGRFSSFPGLGMLMLLKGLAVIRPALTAALTAGLMQERKRVAMVETAYLLCK